MTEIRRADGKKVYVCVNIVRVLAELDRQASARANLFNGVFLETMGLANPTPIAFMFFTNPLDGVRFKLDSIL